MDSLTDHDVAIIMLEAQFWRTAGAKEAAIRDELGTTPVRYYQRLNQLADTESALAQHAVTVNRMRRIRSAVRHPSTR